MGWKESVGGVSVNDGQDKATDLGRRGEKKGEERKNMSCKIVQGRKNEGTV